MLQDPGAGGVITCALRRSNRAAGLNGWCFSSVMSWGQDALSGLPFVFRTFSTVETETSGTDQRSVSVPESMLCTSLFNSLKFSDSG